MMETRTKIVKEMVVGERPADSKQANIYNKGSSWRIRKSTLKEE